MNNVSERETSLDRSNINLAGSRFKIRERKCRNISTILVSKKIGK